MMVPVPIKRTVELLKKRFTVFLAITLKIQTITPVSKSSVSASLLLILLYQDWINGITLRSKMTANP